ncbi:MAG TPA: RNA-binding protein [Methanocorpusculum sp.]|nr:RNA-binding protein [Methanocorpusculum sp.]
MTELVIKKRHAIKKGQLTSLMTKLRESLGDEADQFTAPMIEIAETASKFNIYLVDKKPILMEKVAGPSAESDPGWAFPTLRGAIQRPFTHRRIVVDMGAVPYMINGADIMRPGVVDVTSDVKAGMPAVAVDESHGKPLAVVLPLYDAEGILALEKGKVAKNIHYVGDELWNLEL